MMSAAILTAALTSCSELPEYEGLNPEGTPVKFVLSGDRVFDGAKANIKVTSDVPVPQDVTIKLSLDAEAIVKAENVTFPNLVIKQGETEASGKLELDPTGLRPGATFKVVVKGTFAGVELGSKVSLSYTTEKEPEEPVVTSAITIDGDMSDWANIKGVSSEDGPIYALKATCDANNLYLYAKRNNNSAMWGGGYFYFDFDIDSNPNTGTVKDDITGLESWMYMYFFLAGEDGTPYIADAPSGELWLGGEAGSASAYTCAPNSCKGTFDEDYAEIELVLPLADLGIKVGDEITIYSWGNKSGSNLKSEPIYLKIQDNAGSSTTPSITIDGDLSDWASIKGVSSEDGPIYAFKAAYDADNVYFYVKRNNNSAMWGGGYFYFDLDLDSNPNTGTVKDDITGLESWMYMYFFLAGGDGTPYIADAPAGELWLGGEAGSTSAYTSPANSCKGKFDEDYAEVEIKLPRKDLGIKSGDDATIYCWGNKSGSNLKSEPVYINFKD